MTAADLLQDAIVTVAALGAGTIILRRLLGFVRPKARPGCASCPSAAGACATAAASQAAAAPTTHPLVLVRPPGR